jgi:predicted nuclease of predicted toxin-antitoxin system
MKLKLDENLSRHLKTSLINLGHEVMTVADEHLLSKPDTIIASEAKKEGRILLTLDVGLADIRKAPPGTHPGIIIFRPATLGPLEVNRFVEAFASDNDLEIFRGCIVVVEQKRIRVRRP